MGRYENFLINTFSEEDKTLYQVYFQAIRWIMPDIEEKLLSAKFVGIKIGNSDQYKATYALLTFDQSLDPLLDKTVIISAASSKVLPITVDNNLMNVKLTDLPEEIGRLKLYESIDWK